LTPLQMAERTEKIIGWCLFDRDPLESFDFSNVTLLGDAAHPLLPYGSQGATQAIMDAEALGVCYQNAMAKKTGERRRGSGPAPYGRSVWDAVAAAAAEAAGGSGERRGLFFEEQEISAEELAPGHLQLGPPSDRASGSIVRFGRAAPSLPGSEAQWGHSVACPVAELKRQGHTLEPKVPFVKLAVVLVVKDAENRLLLTQRARHMRTFPNCWVFPGGGVDEDEGLLAAGRRELQEETGLSVAPESMRLFCFWESVFPTSSEKCLELGQVKGHAVTAFVEARLEPSKAELKLQASECQRYTWVSLDGLLGSGPVAGWELAEEALVPCEISADQLHGIYPNSRGEGIGQGHLYALNVLAETSSERASL
ncbi:unnamed protein product, partial [Effrenium voratum]